MPNDSLHKNGKPPAQGPVFPPVVALCLISGDEGVLKDETGTPGLDRLFQSVLDRETGPMFDEVCIYWNGDPDQQPESLKAGVYHTIHGFDIPIQVKVGPWRKDFAWARQLSFELSGAPWRCYLDSDDTIPVASSEAVTEALERAGSSREQVAEKDGGHTPTLRDFLVDLPPAFNAVIAAYHYVEIQGKAAVVNPRTRIVRWADGWCWAKEVHEDIYPIRGNAMRGVFLSGFVVVHKPLRPSVDRLERNIEILRTVEAALGGRDKLAHRDAYGIAAYHFDRGEDGSCLEYLAAALKADPPPPPHDQFIYRCMSAQALCRAHRAAEALEHAMWAVLVAPDRPGGYLELARAYYMVANFGEAVRWFRLGFTKQESSFGSMQHPMTTEGQLRALGAHALLAVNALDEALEWAEKAAAADPGIFPERTLALCQDLVKRSKVNGAYRLLASHLLDLGEIQQLVALRDACPAVLEPEGVAHRLTARIDYEASKLQMVESTRGEDVTPAAREALGIAVDAFVVGSELVKAVDVSAALAAAEEEAGYGPVTVVVPDLRLPVSAQPIAARSGFTPDRLLRVLQSRGWVTSLRADPVTLYSGVSSDHRIGATYVPGVRHRPKTVAIWCPHYVQLWGPDSPAMHGTGGSEEAAVYLAEALVARGYEVTVYAPTPGEDRPVRVASGVIWRPLEEFSPEIVADHLIFHRAPAMGSVAAFAAKHLWTWHHDHFYSEEYWSKRIARTTRHLYVSRWQRRMLEDLIGFETRGKVIYNGIPPKQLVRAKHRLGKHERNPHTAAYASMPSRGLDRLLDIWPEVVAAVPDAKLYLYYGMHTVRQLWRGAHYDVGALLAALERQCARFAQEGSLVYRGRVGQNTLMEEFHQLGCMAYPSAFPEVYMIAGVRALAAGMKLVATNTAALPEIMQNQDYLVDGATRDAAWADGGRERFVSTLVRAMTEPESAYDREAVAARVMEVCTWDGVARRLIEAFTAAEAEDESAFESDVGTVCRDVPEGVADMRVPTDPLVLDALRTETLGILPPA